VSWFGDLGSALLGGLYEYRLVTLLGGAVAVVVLFVVAGRLGWLSAVRRHPGRAVAGLVPVLFIAVPLVWYLGSPLILSSTIDEPAPIAGIALSSGPSASATPRRSAAAIATSEPTPVATTAAPTRPAFKAAGLFAGSDDFHFGRGTARLIETAPGTFVVRLEDFAVRNGPDLYVYLSPDGTGYAADAIELGKLKADRGNQNYAVPPGALDDPSRAASIVIWCKQFSHLFATAPLEQVAAVAARAQS
jgi:hypothetical protein